ncbi:MAG: tRNA 2-selenouridine(34) synthase MnmH [Flavobacteriales bacterium]
MEAQSIRLTNLQQLNAGTYSLILDVRSPGEYKQGHVPGAVNLPLLNNEERHMVGITYKQEGNHAAVRKGFELVGHRFASFIDQARALAGNGDMLVYCWRGGLRSTVMQWLLHTSGCRVSRLHGGYKAFRKLVLDEFRIPHRLIILAGKTGVGKTEVLLCMQEMGQAVIDLEALASHKGSAFGGLGMGEQPSCEHFENMLALQLHSFSEKQIWLESESRSIGKVKIPDGVYENMCTSPTIVLERDEDLRIQRILNEYSHFDKALLDEKTQLISKKMGYDQVKLATQWLAEDNFREWVRILFKYYDKTYLYGLSLRELSKLKVLNTGNEKKMHSIALKILAIAK